MTLLNHVCTHASVNLSLIFIQIIVCSVVADLCNTGDSTVKYTTSELHLDLFE